MEKRGDFNDIAILRTLELAAFLHDVGKPLARYLNLINSQTITPFEPFTRDQAKQESIRTDYEMFQAIRNNLTNKNLLPYHVFTGLLLLQAPFLDESTTHTSVFDLTQTEKNFWQNLGINPIYLKSAILLHHVDKETITEQIVSEIAQSKGIDEKTKQTYLVAYKHIVKYVRLGDHTEASQRTTHESNIPKDLYSLLSLLGNNFSQDTPTHTLRSIPFTSIYEGINNFRNRNFYNLGPNRKAAESTTEKFIDDFKVIVPQAQNPEHLLALLKLLFYKYLMFTPADIMEDIPIISLYEHLYSTALVASNLYILEHLQTNKLALIFIDFPSIQKYIYNIYSTKHALKTLKAKSFLVQLLPELAKTYVYEKLAPKGYISYFHELLNVGGKVSIIFPYNKNIKNELNKIKQELEESIFERFKGEVKLAFAYHYKNLTLDSSANNKILEELNELIADTHKELQSQKSRPFTSILFEESVTPYTIPIKIENDTTLCDICNLYPAAHSKTKGGLHLCPLCTSYEEIGRKLKKAHFLLITPNSINEIGNNLTPSFKNLFSYNIYLLSDKELKKADIDTKNIPTLSNFILIDLKAVSKIANQKLNKDVIPKTNKLLQTTKQLNIMPISKYVYYKDNDTPATLEELSEHNYLAILKGDVDNLGKIFREELDKLYKYLHPKQKNKPYPISYRRTASFWFKFFFEVLIEKAIIETKKSDKQKYKLYTVYTGGDDFVILGDWLDIITLTYKIENEWQRFTQRNPNLTFSASITLFKNKTPILYVTEIAEENLIKAKYHEENKKNKIYLLQDVADKQVFMQALENEPNDSNNTNQLALAILLFYTINSNHPRKPTHGMLYKLLQLLNKLKQQITQHGQLSLIDFEYFKAYLYYLSARNKLFDSNYWKIFIERLKQTTPKEFAEHEISNLIAVLSYIIYKERENELAK